MTREAIIGNKYGWVDEWGFIYAFDLIHYTFCDVIIYTLSRYINLVLFGLVSSELIPRWPFLMAEAG